MVNVCWFSNSATIRRLSGGTSVPVGALKNVKFIPRFKFTELRGMETIYRHCVSKYDYEVDVEFSYAMWDSNADILLWSFLKGDNVADTTDVGTVDDTANYRSKCALFNIEATINDTTGASTITATVYNVYFKEIPVELIENEYISRACTGKGKSISFYYGGNDEMTDVYAYLRDESANAFSSTNPFPINQYGGSVKTTTIAIAEATSAGVDLGNSWSFLGVSMPAEWTTTATLTPATLTFQVSTNNSTWQNLYTDGGTEVTAYATANYALSSNDTLISLLPWRYVKIRNGTSTAPGTQAAARTITFMVK
jgi:hypothetical protein